MIITFFFLLICLICVLLLILYPKGVVTLIPFVIYNCMIKGYL